MEALDEIEHLDFTRAVIVLLALVKLTTSLTFFLGGGHGPLP